MKIDFSKAQKEELQRKVERLKGAEISVNEFVAYLRKEHGVDKGWQIVQDLSGFVRVEDDKKTSKKP